MREKDDYKTYRETVGKLEHALLVETELVSCQEIQKELENYSKDLFGFPIDRKERQAEIDKYTDTSIIRRLIEKFVTV